MYAVPIKPSAFVIRVLLTLSGALYTHHETSVELNFCIYDTLIGNKIILLY